MNFDSTRIENKFSFKTIVYGEKEKLDQYNQHIFQSYSKKFICSCRDMIKHELSNIK